MKKLSMFLIAASMLAFVACGGSKQEEEGTTESTETTATEAEKAVEQPASTATDTASAPATTDTAQQQ